MTSGAADGPSADDVRRWLRRLHTPDRLADPALVALLREHRRLPPSGTPLAVGQAAAELLVESIEKLRPSPGAPRAQQTPYMVLKTCFVDSAKRFQAGARLGMSERQVTREVTRALALLAAELGGRRLRLPEPRRSEPIPRIVGFVGRAEQSDRLAALLSTSRLVHVDGPPGVGKTTLVAEFVADVDPDRTVVWYQLRPGLNDTLSAFVFELVEALRDQLPPDRLDAVHAALLRDDAALVSRLALAALAAPVLVVLDDYHLVEADPVMTGFVNEATRRLSTFQVITISRHRERTGRPGAVLHLPPMTEEETRDLLVELRITADAETTATVHRLTRGLPQLVKFAASWLRTATPDEIVNGTRSLMEVDDVQEFLLNNLTDLIDPEDRHILAAASVFRDRFTDDALAFVAERSRGQVFDTSRRLVRYYLASRSRDGNVAFFHDSVRDYVYSRIARGDRDRFHRRAAQWFERIESPEEAAFHLSQMQGGDEAFW